ncbi:esterase-like activity of phytase family protein [Novosphingobium sp. 1949]|uniref:Esterase-like activity of phytase family protein n=1 Tax=Novosphingobium organovorum TaxID=2930092 RepID=A0ABT0BCR2_9SPHN|nr:esterase-like activity of phytase family protein [Novosphingobium organovorum]MCJ2182840.1 esterase-like activity of phytase family protein [Novosphingobium organovorum]
MRRTIALLVLIAGLLVPIWVRSPKIRLGPWQRLTVTHQPIPDRERLARYLKPFRLEQALRFEGSQAGGYSSLIAFDSRHFLTVSDNGRWLRFDFARPGRVGYTFGNVAFAQAAHDKESRDVESSVLDRVHGGLWLGLEGQNAIVRTDLSLVEQRRVQPAAMHHWGENTGPEAMAHLADGRFIVVRETALAGTGNRRHEGVLFASGDPTRDPRSQPFVFDGPRNFSVVDMAQMPDGRVLVLMRRLAWIAPLRFAGRIVIADPSQIREGKVWASQQVAVLASDMPIDNFEGIAVSPGAHGRLDVWLISDDNFLRVVQKTLLWKLSVDPAELPWPGRSGAASVR